MHSVSSPPPIQWMMDWQPIEYTAFWQDSCGFMWFGTDDGLSRFDGIAFKNYYLSEYINATTSNSVKEKYLSNRRGRMWIGLDTGIVIYDSKTDTFQPFHAKTETGEMIQTYVTDMIEDSDGEVWIATSGEGLYRFFSIR